MTDKYVNLHTHCEYSMLDGYGHPDWFIKRAKELGQSAIAVTDHGNISAHKRWYDSCLEEGIKPILGLEAYIVDDMTKKDGRGYYHITLLAKNLTGYRNLTRMVTASYNEGFYYKPRIDWALLKKYGKGIIATSGCPSGKIGKMINDGASVADVAREMKKQSELVDDYYVELAPWSYEEGVKAGKVIYQAALKAKLPMIITMDCHYPRKDDAFKQDVMLCIQGNNLFEDPKRLKFSQEDFYLKSGKQMEEDWNKIFGKEFPFRKEMIENTAKIAKMVDFEFPRAKPIEFPFKGDKIKLLKRMCWDGLKARGLQDKQEYIDRTKVEFELIVKKDFVDYFLVISDLIKWAKSQGIFVGPARGSSCGSLVCYLTHITEIDPLPYGLLFERFIDINRDDLPDVDIDFEDERRDEVKQYLRRKYGEDHVASLATFGTFKGRLCIQDIGRVFASKIPDSAIQEVKKLIVQRSGGDSRFGFTVEDTFVNFDNAKELLAKYPELSLAKYLEGQIRQLGIHAAGTVVSNEPIENFAAFYRSSNGEKVISMDYHDASSVGLLKIDILGLTTLTVLKRTLQLIKERHKKDIDLNKLTLDDPKVYEYFKNAKLFGIFQFDGQAMMQVCKQVKPDDFKELVAINGLSRPGPLHSGGTTNYVERKWGKQKVSYKHPLIESITGETYGVTIYQEQVMLIVKNIGNFSWADTSNIRRTMSKSQGTEAFSKYEEKFIEGAIKNGLTKELALSIWQEIYTFGSWAFNKSHSVSYTLLAYWMMWLKIYYPLEFYVSMLQCEKQEDKVRKVVKEYIAEGYQFLPVDVNRSGLNFEIDGDGIRTGLTSVMGLGSMYAEKIVKNQPYKDYIEFKEKVGMPKMADILLKIGAFKNLEFTSLQKQQSLFGDHLVSNQDFDYKNPTKEKLREFSPLAVQDKVRKEWMPWIKEHLDDLPSPIKRIENITEKGTVLIIGKTDPKKYFNLKNKMEEYKSRGRAMEVKDGEQHFLQADYDFLNFDIEDETDYVTVRIPYKQYPKYKEMIWNTKPDDVLLVRGMVNGGIRMVFSNLIINLSLLRKKIETGQKLTKEERSVVFMEAL